MIKRKTTNRTYAALYSGLFVLSLIASFGIVSVAPKVDAADCSNERACEIAIQYCIEKNGTWNGTTGECEGEEAVDTEGECNTAGGTWKEVRTNQPNVPDGVVFRCQCASGQTMTNGKCQNTPLDGQPGTGTGGQTIEQDCTKGVDSENCGIVGYIRDAVNILSVMSGIIIIIMIIVGGLQYATGFGATDKDPMAVGAAKHKISNAVLALFIYTFFYAFLNWIIPGGLL